MTTAPLPDRSTATSRKVWPLVVSGAVVIALVIAVIVAFTGGGSDSTVTKLDPSISAPPGDLSGGFDPSGTKVGTITYTTFDGRTETLTPGSKPLMVNFWSSTCAPCVAEMPALERFANSNSGAVTVLGLDYAETPEMGRAMAQRTGITYPIARDPKGQALAALGGKGLPYTVLIATDGTVLAAHSGAMDESQMAAMLATATGHR